MNAAKTIRMAEASGIHIGVAGTDLILDADREPAPRVLEALRSRTAPRHVVAL